MRSWIVLLLVAPLALAGCTSEAPTAEPLETGAIPSASVVPVSTDPLPAAELVAAAGEAPVWALGDAWAIVSHNGDVEERGFLVVTRAEGDNYVIETTLEQAAAFDAMLDVSYLGNIRMRDLAGYQQGEPIQYFDFPLADGKTWSTNWDGQNIALTATAAARGFTIVGTTEDGANYVEYDYTPDLKWWSKLEFVRDGYGIRIESLRSGWTGALAAATAEVVYEAGPAAPTASPNSGAFTIAEGQTFGMVMLRGGGSLWARSFALVDPAGQPFFTENVNNFEMSDAAAAPQGYSYFEQIPPTPGEWHIASPTAHHPDGAAYVTIYQVATAVKQFP